VDIVKTAAATDIKNLYNSSASSTSVVTSANFSAWLNKGHIVSDIINIQGLLANMTFGDLDSVGDFETRYLPIDGWLGISPALSKNQIPNVLAQLAPSLDSPVVNIRIKRQYRDYTGANSSAQISFGSAQLSQCQQSNGNAQKLTLNSASKPYQMFSTVNASSVSIVNANLSDACAVNTVQASHPVMIVDYFYPMLVSYQLQELLISASGAQFNQTSGWYQVDCSQVGNASPVNISLVDGNVLTLKPNDYILQTKGQCILYIYEWYDEKDAWYNKIPSHAWATVAE